MVWFAIGARIDMERASGILSRVGSFADTARLRDPGGWLLDNPEGLAQVDSKLLKHLPQQSDSSLSFLLALMRHMYVQNPYLITGNFLRYPLGNRPFS